MRSYPPSALRSALAGAALLLAAGCGRSEGYELRTPEVGAPPPDAGPGLLDAGRDAGPSDAAGVDAGSDAGRPDAAATCPATRVWQLEPRRLVPKATNLIGLPPRAGATERLEVQVQLLGGCEELAGVQVMIHPGGATDFIELKASAWVPVDEACDPSAPVATTIVSIPGREQGNPHVTVRDGEDGAILWSYNYDRRYACTGGTDCSCGPGSPAGTGARGAVCLTDCSCQWPLACVGFEGPAGPEWRCEAPCVTRASCGGARCSGRAELPPRVCVSEPTCAAAGDCAAGFECQAGRCADVRPGGYGPCACDAQCAPGLRCLEFGGGGYCEIPCSSIEDCPSPFTDWSCDGHFCAMHPF